MLLAVFLFASILGAEAQSYEFKIVTTIESVVQMVLGRSRIISSEEEKNYQDYTSSRTEENNKQNKSKRADAKIDNFDETKILNFFSAAGINFQNITSNDAVISSKVNTMIDEGWELAFVTSCVESDAGKGDDPINFITQFIFKRLKS